MSLRVQEILVALLVVGCALYSFWRLATVNVRLRVLGRLEALPGARTALAPLKARTLAQMTSACGGCSPAGHAATPDAASRNRTPGALRR
jgi:hypothetical protein